MEAGKIVTYGNEILRKRSEEVEEFNNEIKDLIEEMYVTLAESHGVGLAGPQVGVSKRVFVYDVGEGHHALVNPVMLSSSGEEWGFEGCLSIPGLQGEVPRATRVVVIGINEEGKKVKVKATGLLARCFQHEMDHLDGTVFIDRADPDTLEMVPISEEGEEEGES
ncbi:MAG: peptide deformylase [Armatimonadota bacterium]|nr:peptide deformylase [bacterium]